MNHLFKSILIFLAVNIVSSALPQAPDSSITVVVATNDKELRSVLKSLQVFPGKINEYSHETECLSESVGGYRFVYSKRIFWLNRMSQFTDFLKSVTEQPIPRKGYVVDASQDEIGRGISGMLQYGNKETEKFIGKSGLVFGLDVGTIVSLEQGDKRIVLRPMFLPDKAIGPNLLEPKIRKLESHEFKVEKSSNCVFMAVFDGAADPVELALAEASFLKRRSEDVKRATESLVKASKEVTKLLAARRGLDRVMPGDPVSGLNSEFQKSIGWAVKGAWRQLGFDSEESAIKFANGANLHTVDIVPMVVMRFGGIDGEVFSFPLAGITGQQGDP